MSATRSWSSRWPPGSAPATSSRRQTPPTRACTSSSRSAPRRRVESALPVPVTGSGAPARAAIRRDPSTAMTQDRSHLQKARRLVVKVGSRSLAAEDTSQRRVAEAIARLLAAGRSSVLVSSGAIAIGCRRLGYRARPKEMSRLQAAAAAGQSVLMRRYDEAFGELGITTAQVLLTHADLADRERLNNARDALAALLEAGALPIVNENDTVATDEIRFGDNDQLAAMITPLVGADLLVLLTDVDGVLDDQGRRISVMRDDVTIGRVAAAGAPVGSGGMQSKLDAARKASRSGANVVIAPAGLPSVLDAVV